MGISGFVLLTFIFSFFISHTTSSVFDEVNHHRYLKKSDIPEDIPFESPSNGTDIISHPVALIKCKNQTKCVQPALQLERKYNVYYCKRVSYGVRFYFLVREGLLLHPNLQMVESPQDADIVLYLPESAAWHKSECNNPNFAHKLVVMDEGDGPQILEGGKPNWNLMYFKRSFVRRHDGVFKGYMNYLFDKSGVLPMTYPLAEAYVRTTFPTVEERDLELVCTLRENVRDPTRTRVKSWVNEYAQTRGLSSFQAKEVNHASRTTVDKGYFNQMFRARIIVTANPSGWEGDFRFMEAVASGALIFVDRMFTPRPHALVHGQHVVYYNNMNKTDLFSKLDDYRQNVKKSRNVAISGYLHSMKYHRATCLLDYVMRTVHLKQMMSAGAAILPNYHETGFDLRETALQVAAKFKKKQGNKKSSRLRF